LRPATRRVADGTVLHIGIVRSVFGSPLGISAMIVFGG